MANKKYNQFTAGVPAGTDILLFADPTTGALEKTTVAELVAAAAPYKVYTALLTQTGTSAPVATVLENTLGGTVVWTRDNVGTYTGTLSGAFTENKTSRFSSDLNSPADGDGASVTVERINANQIACYTGVRANAEALDDVLNYTFITIQVYH